MKQLRITGVAIVSDCFDPEHPKEEAVNLIAAVNNVLCKLGGAPVVTFKYGRLRVKVEEIAELEDDG